MSWTATTLTVHYDNGADGREETFAACVNEFGLYVAKVGGSWQVDNAEGLRLKGLIGTRKAARELADKMGPMAPFGWSELGVRRWRAERPDDFADMKRLAA